METAEDDELCKEEVAIPEDIEKRFQHLVDEWSSFQQRAGSSVSKRESLSGDLGAADALFQQREEQLKNSEKRLIEEQTRLSDMRNYLLKYEVALSERERSVRKQELDVAESQQAATASLVEVQKRSAEISVEDCRIQEKQQQLEDFEKQLGKAMQDMLLETEALNKKKQECHEQNLQICAREKAVQLHLVQCEEEKEKLKAEWAKLEEERAVDSKARKETKEREERVAAKEKTVEEKFLAVENLVQKLDAREKLLQNIKKQCEEERNQIHDLMVKMDIESKSTEDAEKEFEISKNYFNEALKRFSIEQQQAVEDKKLTDEKIKILEERVKKKEKDLMQKQKVLEMLDSQVKKEQHQNHILQSKIQIEQEKMMEEMTIQEENIKKKELILKKKEENVKKILQKLVEKRNLVDLKLKQLKEIEIRTESLEDELRMQHQEHLQKVEAHARKHEAELQQLETRKHDLQLKSAEVDRRFQEVQAMKEEAKQCQKKVEREFHEKVEALLKDKAHLETQKQNVINLQHHIEKAGTKVMDHMMTLDGASIKIDMLLQKLEVSEKKLHVLVKHISQQQKFLIEKEKALTAKEKDQKHDFAVKLHHAMTEHEESVETFTPEVLQQALVRIIKDRDNFTGQQRELEQTKKEVQNAKLTLAEMVMGASITAHRASRERQALEQERRRLVKALFATREARIPLDERNLEGENDFVKEREHASRIIYKAEQIKKAVNSVEGNGNGGGKYPRGQACLAKAMHGRRNKPFSSEERLKAPQNLTTAGHNSKSPEMISLWRGKECAKIDREEKMVMDELSRLRYQHEAEMKTSGNKDSWTESGFVVFQGCEAGNGSCRAYPGTSLHQPLQDSCDGPVSEEPVDGFFFSGTESPHLKDIDHEGTNYEDASSNLTRLQSVMQGLLNARDASRSRLQKAHNMMRTLVSGGGGGACIVSEVQHALHALTDRLIAMEQMEDELTDELKEAYHAALPNSEVVLVDKVELLSRMEEQQTLRAEWEEDMQSQLEKISMHSQSPSSFTTPVKRTVFDHIVVTTPSTTSTSQPYY